MTLLAIVGGCCVRYCGSSKDRVDLASPPISKTRVNVAFEDLGLSLRGSNTRILEGVTGTMDAGCVTAIMGPSGAGKTSLMNAIAGRASGYGIVDGSLTVTVNGVITNGGLEPWSNLCGFVPQDDIMLPELTVRQT